MRSTRHLLLFACLLLSAPLTALAADPCPLLRAQVESPDPATRLAAAACEEHLLWHRPFIDIDGRYAGSTVREAETALLTNGEQAWRRVTGYWRGAALLPRLQHRPGAGDCLYAPLVTQPSAACRSFLVDVPWSAAFVSWVSRRAALPGFNGSPSHVDYVRDAYRNPESNAYRVANPVSTRPARGDMLCYVRAANRVFGFAGLATLLSSEDGGLGMHCDIVVGLEGAAYLVGGNVLDGVTMRLLPLTAGGQFANLPQRTLDDPACTPDAPQACNANRQDWAVLLQLRPAAELAALAPAPMLETASPQMPGDAGVLPQGPARPQPTACCVECSAGDGLPRCPGS